MRYLLVCDMGANVALVGVVMGDIAYNVGGMFGGTGSIVGQTYDGDSSLGACNHEKHNGVVCVVSDGPSVGGVGGL